MTTTCSSSARRARARPRRRRGAGNSSRGGRVHPRRSPRVRRASVRPARPRREGDLSARSERRNLAGDSPQPLRRAPHEGDVRATGRPSPRRYRVGQGGVHREVPRDARALARTGGAGSPRTATRRRMGDFAPTKESLEKAGGGRFVASTPSAASARPPWSPHRGSARQGSLPPGSHRGH